MKKRVSTTTRITVIITLAVLLTAAFIIVHRQGTDDPVVFTVSGEPVTKREFANVMSGLRANVFTYFSQKYGAKDDGRFWTSRYGGEVPLDVLKQRTIDKLKRIKAEQILMKQNGIADDISYAGYIRQLKTENERRSKAIKNGEPIFGPQQFEETAYYGTLHGNRVEELIKKLTDRQLTADEDEIERYYSAHKYEQFKRIPDITYEEITAKTEALAREAREAAATGERLGDAAGRLRDEGQSGIEYDKRVFGESTYREDTRAYPMKITRLMEMTEGQISDVIQENGSYMVIKVLKASPESYYALNDVKDQIKKTLIDEKYVELIDKQVRDSRTTINEDVLGKIS